MPTIFVTGATGFIGQPLCAALLEHGYDVIASARSVDKSRPFDKKIAFVAADIESSDSDMWRDALKGVDTLIHLAACVHDHRPKRDQAYRRVNTFGTSRLCRMAVECGVRQFIYLSTLKVNGETSPRPFSEDDPPRAQGPYARSKWQAEEQIKAITQDQVCEYVIIRPPLVYGPQVKANFYRLLKIMATNLPLPLSSLHNRRSLIYVGNLVDAIITAMECPHAAGQVFMVSDGQDLSVADLMKALARAFDYNARLFPFPPSWLYRIGMIVGRGETVAKLSDPLTVDISKIRKTLEWRPPFSIHQGLAETVDWFRNSDRPV